MHGHLHVGFFKLRIIKYMKRCNYDIHHVDEVSLNCIEHHKGVTPLPLEAGDL